MAVARGGLLNLGVYQAARSVLGLPLGLSHPALFFCAIMALMSAALAVTSSLVRKNEERNETEEQMGDKTQTGTNRVVGAAHGMLSIGYAGAILAAGIVPAGLFNRTVFGVGHVLLGVALILYMTGVTPSSKKSVKGFHNFIWKLFYAEHVLFPFL